MLASVLVPVLDEARYLPGTVPTMLAQQLDGEIEFLFAEGRSKDRSRAILEQFARRDWRVRVLDSPTGRTPDSLNVALGHASGEFVARMDAHAFYPPTYLADGIARLRGGDAAWVAGPAVPRRVGGASGAIALALSSPLGQGPSRRLARRGLVASSEYELDTGVFAGVWWRRTLLSFRGWDSGWLRNQDSELAARFKSAGLRLVGLPSMAAEYAPRRTLAALARQYHGYGRYRARTALRYPAAARRSHTLMPALVIAVPLAASRARIPRHAARIALATYGALIGGETALAARAGAAPADVIRLPAAFITLHFAWGLGALRGLTERAIGACQRQLASHDPPGANHADTL